MAARGARLVPGQQAGTEPDRALDVTIRVAPPATTGQATAGDGGSERCAGDGHGAVSPREQANGRTGLRCCQPTPACRAAERGLALLA